MKTALVLLQLGVGDNPSKFLKALLSDRRVKKQTLLWKILLNCCIRFQRKKHHESPIISYTEDLTRKLQAKFPDLEVRYALNYFNIEEILDSLSAQRIILQPLFPLYSSSVVGSVLERALLHLSKKILIPEVIVAPLFYENQEYISALVEKIKDTSPDALVLSYHSIPLIHVKAGDPYQERCEAMSAAIRAALTQDEAWRNVIIKHAYQSKYGRGEWLTPSLKDTIQELKASGIDRISVVPAGFLIDCSETLIEIDKELRDFFYKLGGKDFQRITCFNADDVLVQIIEHSIKRYL